MWLNKKKKISFTAKNSANQKGKNKRGCEDDSVTESNVLYKFSWSLWPQGTTHSLPRLLFSPTSPTLALRLLSRKRPLPPTENVCFCCETHWISLEFFSNLQNTVCYLDVQILNYFLPFLVNFLLTDLICAHVDYQKIPQKWQILLCNLTYNEQIWN